MMRDKKSHLLSGRGATRRSRRGYVLLTMGVAAIAIMGFAGLVADLGFGEYERRRAQAAADAGAKAAGLAIMNSQPSLIAAQAKQDTANNGFTDTVNGVTVTVNHPPLTGFYKSNNAYAEVIINKTLPTNFMGMLGVDSMTIFARGVGGGVPGACIYALDPAAQDAIVASGSSQINAGCGVIDESSNSKALDTTGSACITGSSIQVVGNYSGSCISPTPKTGITSPGDPLVGKYTRPTPGACTFTNWNNSGTTLSPGTYCGGISIGGGTTVTASAGLYILYGGGLTVSGGSNLAGTGVTFYNTNNGGSYKPFTISGTSSATQLSAPSSGAYEGLLFFQDPNLPSNLWSQKDTISGTSATKFEGTVYLKHTNLVYSGGSNLNTPYTIIVADTITFSGPSVLNADYSSLSLGSPIKTNASVAE
jgi:Putative Flp pilus-assembly TadE/G-like